MYQMELVYITTKKERGHEFEREQEMGSYIGKFGERAGKGRTEMM